MRIMKCIFLVWMTLKLTHEIDWSWWAVCSPLIADIFFVAIEIVSDEIKSAKRLKRGIRA